jgi:hypothetical protein
MMPQNFFAWWKSAPLPARPWLILGKGPSFSRRASVPLGDYHLLGLNHVCREQPVTLAHVIDLDVVDACAEALETRAQWVVMPWRPHVARARWGRGTRRRPSSAGLAEFAATHPVLRRLRDRGRLLWYNLATAQAAHGASPVVDVSFFSAEAALNLLALAGVQCVRSLGVDGGTAYGQEFGDLSGTTRLADGQGTFDRQFRGIARTLLRTGIDFAPLFVESPIRVYVGATEAQMLAVKVLEYSIRKHTSMSVEVYPLHRVGIDIPMPNDPACRPRTPFSFQRFLIPAAAGHRGRAIYLDSDMQVFRDLRQLWTLPFGDADVLSVAEPPGSGRPSQFSVMLLDCERLGWEIGKIVAGLDEGRLGYDALMGELAVARCVRATIPHAWNCLDRFKKGETALLHYTDMMRQPWVSAEHPLGRLWVRDLLEALDAGFVDGGLVEEHVRRGWVRPSLLYQLERRCVDGRLLSAGVLARDRDFVPPYCSIAARRGRSGARASARLRALARHWAGGLAPRRLRRRVRRWLRS